MLKTRIIPTLLCRGRELVKGERFNSWRRVGTVMQAARVHQMRGVDELLLLDIDATVSGRGPDFDLIRDLTDECFMPITIGGGVRCVEDIQELLAAGADKVALNTTAFENPPLILEASRRFGAQAIVVSIDHAQDGTVAIKSGTKPTSRDAVGWAIGAAYCGAGEIILSSIDRDGTMTGYDRTLIEKVSSAVSIPVIASGGCAGYADMAAILESTEAHAVAAGALFQFTDATPRGAAEYLADKGFAVRLAA